MPSMEKRISNRWAKLLYTVMFIGNMHRHKTNRSRPGIDTRGHGQPTIQVLGRAPGEPPSNHSREWTVRLKVAGVYDICMDPGKVDRAFFEDHIRDRLGAQRDDVRLGPTHGADFGLIDVGDRTVALATDPVFVLRDLGIERAAWFAFHIVLSDVALS